MTIQQKHQFTMADYCLKTQEVFMIKLRSKANKGKKNDKILKWASHEFHHLRIMSLLNFCRRNMTSHLKRDLTKVNSKLQKHVLNLKSVRNLIFKAIEKRNASIEKAKSLRSMQHQQPPVLVVDENNKSKYFDVQKYYSGIIRFNTSIKKLLEDPIYKG